MSLDALTVHPATFLAIVAMAVATAATRLVGLALPTRMLKEPRLKAMLEAVPPAVLAALIAPTVLTTGWAESLAAVVTALAALRLPLLAVVAIGVASAALLRAAGL